MLPAPTRQISPTEAIDEQGRRFLLFGGCNYLGLAQHPAVVEAVRTALSAHSLSAGASRTTTGNSGLHQQLERELADFLGQPDACLLPDGYTANIAACQALRQLGITRCAIDARAHPSLSDAVSTARLEARPYTHRQPPSDAACILTDGVFTGDGSCAPVADLLDALPDDGVLLVDDCHGFAAIGPGGRGTTAGHTHDPRLLLTTTLAKGLGAAGGVVAGQHDIIEAVRKASAFVCTTPISPVLAAGSLKALEILRSEPKRFERLAANTRALRETVRAALGSIDFEIPEHPAPIVGLAPFTPDRLRAMHAHMREAGVIAPLIAYPGGATALYFRMIVTSEHAAEQIERLGEALRDAVRDSALSQEYTGGTPVPPVKQEYVQRTVNKKA